jgi:hypothetical protein
MRIIICATLLAVASINAEAGTPITAGNVLQPSCNPVQGSFYPANGYKPKTTKVSTGKSITAGDVVFYASLAKFEPYYSSTKNAEIKDKSPVTPDTPLEANKLYSVWGIYKIKETGKQYIILNTTGSFRYGMAVLKEDGFLCSDMVFDTSGKGAYGFAGMPQAYQEIPFTLVEKTVEDARQIAVAITLKEFDAVSFKLNVTVLVNGKVNSTKEVGFDLISGMADIGGLHIEAEAEGKTSIKIKSISEPSDYAVWLNDVFKINKI